MTTIVVTLGWAVVHSLWQATLIGGLTALALSVLSDRSARARYWTAAGSLAAMAIAPAVTALAGADVLDDASRRQALAWMESAMTRPAILQWRAWLVPALAALWIAGVTFCLLRVAGEWRRARRLQTGGLDDAGIEVRAMAASVSERLAIGRPVTIQRSVIAGVPMVVGWRRPQILLPAASLVRLDADQIRAVVAHELAHVRRHDYVANLAQLAADALLFHHPVARWVSRQLRIEREYCCDDVALTIGEDPVRYARALSTLEEARAECRLAVAAVSGTLLDRVQRIVGQPRSRWRPVQGVLALAAASLIAAILLGVSAAVPPSLPLDTRARMRAPAPPGAALSAPPGSLPRTRMPGAGQPR